MRGAQEDRTDGVDDAVEAPVLVLAAGYGRLDLIWLRGVQCDGGHRELAAHLAQPVRVASGEDDLPAPGEDATTDCGSDAARGTENDVSLAFHYLLFAAGAERGRSQLQEAQWRGFFRA